MATKNVFAQMLNQKPVSSPEVKAKGVKVSKPIGTPEFAFLGSGRDIFKHPMENRGRNVAGSAWAKIASTKGKKNG